MDTLFMAFLFLHILAAIVAFGPTYAFPLIASAGARHPQHAAFAAELSERIEWRLVLPAALTMPVSGALMIITAGIDLFQPWLLIAIVLYIAAITYSIVVQAPAGKELTQLLTSMASASPGPGAAAAEQMSGPPPRLVELGAKMQRGGIILSVLLVAILALMVFGANT